mgnify:CR=1 FL=1
MAADINYIKINRESWNRRTEAHIHSEFYDVESFLQGKSSLNSIELDLLGALKGKSILHLQCHFGQDSISLSRMGGEVTGVDFSETAIEYARKLAAEAGTDAQFICSDIYELPNKHLNKTFDIVFTSYGTIGWLPDMEKWANIISTFLKPGGEFVFVEFHPVVWMFDYDFKKVAYNYFNAEAIIETESGTYADPDSTEKHDSVSWNHPISDVVNALIDKKLIIESLNEYDYSPYNCFKHTEEFEPGKFRIKHLKDCIPMVYSIKASKKSN